MDYLALCRELGLSALVEAHDDAEIETALRAGADIIGVNNRNLKDFSLNHIASEIVYIVFPVYFVQSGLLFPFTALKDIIMQILT